MKEALLNLLKFLGKETTGIGVGTITGAFSLLINTIIGGARQLMKFHEEGIAFSRDMGMSLNQARAYTKALTENTAELAFKYGVTSEAIMKVQRGLAEATNRQLMLNKSQTDSFVQLNKLVGENTVSKFAEEMMQGMGAQVGAVEGAIAKAYATAAKSGLGAKKTAEIIASSLNIANKLSFKNGVDGLTKMAMQAQKVGMSLQSVESVAKTFMDFDSSIEHAAQLQMLGGAAGALGGNPLDMMYEANYDPEALQDRMIKMMSGYATFDVRTGISKVNGMGMDFIRNIAKAMGMDEGEAVKVAKKNAELRFKEQKFGGRFQGYTQEQQDWVMNKSYVRNGRLYMTNAEGQERDISGGLTEDLIKEMTQFAGKSDREIMEEQAKSLTSINEKLAGLMDSIKGIFANKLEPLIPKIQAFIEKYGGVIIDKVGEFAESAVKALPGIWEWTKNAAKTVKDFFDTAEKWWDKIHAAIILLGGYFAFKGARNLVKGVKGNGAPAATGKPAGGSAKPGGTPPAGGGSKPGGVSHKGHTYTKNSQGHWVDESGRNAPKSVRSELNKKANNLANKPAAQPNPSSTQNAAKPGAWSKAKNIASKGVKGVKSAGKAVGKTGALTAAFALWEMYDAYTDYDKIVKEIKENSELSNEQKLQLLQEAKKRKYAAMGSAVGGGVLGTLAAGLTAASGIFTGGASTLAAGAAGVAGYEAGSAAGEWVGNLLAGDTPGNSVDEYAKGGPIRGNNIGQPKMVKAHVGEFVMSPEMVNGFGQFFKNPGLYAMPVGKNDFTYKPGNTEVSKVGDNTITVKDFNINIGGTLKLEAGNNLANVNMNELMRDPVFLDQLKELIRKSISSSYNGGRQMNDIATMRGMVAQTTILGRRGN